MCIDGIQKSGADEPICRAGIETQTYRMDFWTQRQEGEGEMYGKSNMENLHYCM